MKSKWRPREQAGASPREETVDRCEAEGPTCVKAGGGRENAAQSREKQNETDGGEEELRCGWHLAKGLIGEETI